MKRTGQVLIAVGFMAGALISVLDEVEVAWGSMAGALMLGAVGVVLINVSERRLARVVRETGAGIAELEAALARLARSIGDLDERKHEINTYDVRGRIDADTTEDRIAFAESREAISHVYGLQAYADVMSHFAAGERYLNRVWSCSADGYVDEVNDYLPRAHAEFDEALRMLHALREAA